MIHEENVTRRGMLKLAAAAGVAGSVWIYPGRRSFATTNRVLDLGIERTRITVDGVTGDAIAIGGSIPAPTLRWREGEEVVIRVTNRLDEPTSIHWHGLLLPGIMDGAPGFNGYAAIQPGDTYTYRFHLRQSGTYWYHSHSGLQEQAGMYGAIVIEPSGREPIRYDRDYVVVLSDHTQESPMRVLRNLKADSEYYNRGRRTLVDFFEDADRDGFGAAFNNRLDWGEMRMDPTDLADVTGYAFLVNGKGPEDNWTALFAPGDRVRLRIINASAMSFFDVRIPDLPMTVVAADGQFVMPVPIDEFRFGVGETYDVIVHPRDDRAYTIFAEPLDRSGYGRATLATRLGAIGEIPERRPRAILTMADMGMAHEGMDHSAMTGGVASAPDGIDHAAMGHAMPADEGPMPMETAGERPAGWADAASPPGSRALRYEDLRALSTNKDPRETD